MSFRWYYVDDSGAPQTGWIVFGYLELEEERWGAALDQWLEFREYLWARHLIPVDCELHAHHFVNGRGNPSNDVGWNRDKGKRREVTVAALRQIAELPGARVGAVVRHTEARQDAYAADRACVYAELLARLSARLERRSEFGTIVLDGDGTDPSYGLQHHALEKLTRRIIEDPFQRPAHLNHLLQAADLIAYTAYQAVLRDPARHAMHDWFELHLSPIGEISAV